MTCLFAVTFFFFLTQGDVYLRQHAQAASCFIYKAAEVAMNLFEKALRPAPR